MIRGNVAAEQPVGVPRHDASMEPRMMIRGNMRRRASAASIAPCFNGAADDDPAIARGSTRRYRRFNGAADDDPRKPQIAISAQLGRTLAPLQWSRG